LGESQNFAGAQCCVEGAKGKEDRLKLVVGNTSSGLYKEIATLDVFVDISQVRLEIFQVLSRRCL
jgi:hypothetical protein